MSARCVRHNVLFCPPQWVGILWEVLRHCETILFDLFTSLFICAWTQGFFPPTFFLFFLSFLPSLPPLPIYLRVFNSTRWVIICHQHIYLGGQIVPDLPCASPFRVAPVPVTCPTSPSLSEHFPVSAPPAASGPPCTSSAPALGSAFPPKSPGPQGECGVQKPRPGRYGHLLLLGFCCPCGLSG